MNRFPLNFKDRKWYKDQFFWIPIQIQGFCLFVVVFMFVFIFERERGSCLLVASRKSGQTHFYKIFKICQNTIHGPTENFVRAGYKGFFFLAKLLHRLPVPHCPISLALRKISENDLVTSVCILHRMVHGQHPNLKTDMDGDSIMPLWGILAKLNIRILYKPGVRVTKPIYPVPIFSEFIRIIKPHISYWISDLYLTGD